MSDLDECNMYFVLFLFPSISLSLSLSLTHRPSTVDRSGILYESLRELQERSQAVSIASLVVKHLIARMGGERERERERKRKRKRKRGKMK